MIELTTTADANLEVDVSKMIEAARNNVEKNSIVEPCLVLNANQALQYELRVEEVVRENRAMRDLLKHLEWSAEENDCIICPCCRGISPDDCGSGHEEDCQLAYLIGEHKQ